MTPTPAPPLANLLEHQAANHQLAPWLRVAMWCWAHADHHGHARAYAGQIRTDLDLTTPRDVSRAIRLARTKGLIDRCSTAACLVVPGHAIAPCEAPHRESP